MPLKIFFTRMFTRGESAFLTRAHQLEGIISSKLIREEVKEGFCVSGLVIKVINSGDIEHSKSEKDFINTELQKFRDLQLAVKALNIISQKANPPKNAVPPIDDTFIYSGVKLLVFLQDIATGKDIGENARLALSKHLNSILNSYKVILAGEEIQHILNECTRGDASDRLSWYDGCF